MKLPKLTRSATLAILAVSATGVFHASALSTSNVSSGLQQAADQGRVSADAQQTLTVVLKLHNQAAFDAAVKDLYDPESAGYHKWFTDADFAKYAPTAADVKTVQDELTKQGLSVVSVDRQNFSIRVRGNTSTVEKAFQTQLHTFNYKKSTFQAHVSEARLPGAAGELVDSVVGLDRHQVRSL
jgi:subtilase family serine protease